VRVAGGPGRGQAAVPLGHLDRGAVGDRWPGPGDFARTRRLGAARFEQAVRREITRRGGQKPCLRIVRGLVTALADPAGVIAHRAGALERVQLLAEDWRHTQDRLAETERRMTAVLDELGLTGLVTSMTGLSAIGAAAILAETGDPRRFATARAVVKHAGLAPREKLSGAFTGRTRLTGQGRPGLRLAAWRAVWAAQRANPVYAARYQYLTSSPPQASRANAICERMIGTLRRELLDRLLIVNEHHLRRVLTEYLRHYNTARPHRSLGQLAPAQAHTRPSEINLAEHRIRRKQVLGGLTHEYQIAA
jgi:transposase InsO family protein